MIFEGCKGAKIGKTDKSAQKHRFNLSFCKVEITFYVNISEKPIIFKKKARKSVIFCLNILQIRKKAVSLHRNQETTRLLLSREILLYLYCVFFGLFTFSVIKSILYICALLSYHITYYV